MNEIKLKDYDDFPTKWKLVTVRYRSDSKELRFTYANDLAWEALRDFKGEYPEGAVFAKTGIKTNEDPFFPSSQVPSGSRRIQFMLKNAEKYKSTDGWGYALFDSNGNTFPEDPYQTSMACAACHRIVKTKDYVFSEVAPLLENGIGKVQDSVEQNLEFEDLERDSLPESLKEQLPKSFSNVRSLSGALRENMFQGTLDEIKPALLKESLNAEEPAILLSKDLKRFSVIWEEESGTKIVEICKDKSKFKLFHSVSTNLDLTLSELEICHEKD